MKTKQEGFTLVEIAVAISIISLLAAVAVPAYKNYVLKSKFSEVILQTAAIKQSVSLCLKEFKQPIGCTGGTNGVLTDTTAINKTKYTLSVITTDGVITATARGIDDSAAILAAGGAPSSVKCWQGWCAAPSFVPFTSNGHIAYNVVCPVLPGLMNTGYFPDWTNYYAGKMGAITMFMGSTPYSCSYTGTPAPALKPTGLQNETFILTPIIDVNSAINWNVSGSCIAAKLCSP